VFDFRQNIHVTVFAPILECIGTGNERVFSIRNDARVLVFPPHNVQNFGLFFSSRQLARRRFTLWIDGSSKAANCKTEVDDAPSVVAPLRTPSMHVKVMNE
jgi:hypothetical protein